MNTNTKQINPAVVFYGNYEHQIQMVRETLFMELDAISPDFGIEARKILNEKLKSNKENPLLGELFPWIIKDLVNANTETTHQISVGWLAIYLYTLFLDEYVDDPKPMSSTKFIAGSVLAKTGLLKISKFTNHTTYEEYVNKAFSFSAHNQNQDTKLQNKVTETDLKTKYSEGKNYIVLACAGALAAENSKYGEFITQFTSTLLLTLQYLDDIADYEEDYKLNNYTVLLNDALQSDSKFKSLLAKASNRKLLIELINTGALQRVVEKIHLLLNQSMEFIKKYDLTKPSKKVSVDFLISLQTYISSFNNFLKINSTLFKQLPARNQKVILDKTEKFITIIAQST